MSKQLTESLPSPLKGLMTDSSSPPAGGHLPAEVLLSLAACCGTMDQKAADLVARFNADVEVRSSESEPETINLLLRFIGRCIDDNCPVVYQSVPITTGRAYLDYHIRIRSEGNWTRQSVYHRESARLNNEQRAHKVAGKLRSLLTSTVIDPSYLIDIPGWEQADYHEFWVSVIEQYAQQIILLDGWQYSVGCAVEFAAAVRLGLPTFTEHLSPLSVDDGENMLRSAIQDYISAGLDPEPLRRSSDTAKRAVSIARSRREI
jgi:hypothetical protein